MPALLVLLLAGCAVQRLEGVNLLQSREVSFAQAPTSDALARLDELGANAVAIVVFLEQDGTDKTDIRRSAAVTDHELVAAIRAARRAGLRVLLKPQMLVADGWAGSIDAGSDAGWARWFKDYTRHLVAYARIAEAEGVDEIVIGTELRRADARPEWPRVIAAVRNAFSGKLSYAAHNLEGLTAFPHWHLLDRAAVTLYPSLGDSAERAAMQPRIQTTARKLKELAARIGKPLWIAEIGIQSRDGAQQHPWEWQNPDPHAVVALQLQADVIDLWLTALQGDWNRGVLLWAWSNDPAAGGPDDRDYLLQNKPVEEVLRCHWSRAC